MRSYAEVHSVQDADRRHCGAGRILGIDERHRETQRDTDTETQRKTDRQTDRQKERIGVIANLASFFRWLHKRSRLHNDRAILRKERPRGQNCMNNFDIALQAGSNTPRTGKPGSRPESLTPRTCATPLPSVPLS